jgi:hypothetical protein
VLDGRAFFSFSTQQMPPTENFVNSTASFNAIPLVKPNLDSIMNDQVQEMDVVPDEEREAKTIEGFCVECGGISIITRSTCCCLL